jgi:hypothetical protein
LDILTTTYGLRSLLDGKTATVDMIQGVFDPSISYMPLNYVWLKMLDEAPLWAPKDYRLMETFYKNETFQASQQRGLRGLLKAAGNRWDPRSFPNVRFKVPPYAIAVGLSYRKVDPRFMEELMLLESESDFLIQSNQEFQTWLTATQNLRVGNDWEKRLPPPLTPKAW